MSRLYINCENKKQIRIEFTTDCADLFKPRFEELFGPRFLAAETREGDLLVYKFEPDECDFDLLAAAIKKRFEERVVKDIEIDLNMN